MIAKFTGRIVYLPRGRDPHEDLNLLADAIAESGADLFDDQGEQVVWITAGKRVEVGPDKLREIIAKHVVTKHPAETATGWEVEYRPYEPDTMTLHTLLTAKTTREDGGLLWRLPRTPRVLSRHQQREVRARLERGERAGSVGRDFGVDGATIERLAR